VLRHASWVIVRVSVLAAIFASPWYSHVSTLLFQSVCTAQYNGVGARKHFGIYWFTPQNLFCGTRTIQNIITNYTSIWEEEAKGIWTVAGECTKMMTVYFFHSDGKEEENVRCPQLVDHRETKSRGEQNPERRYKLPGHVLFQHAHAGVRRSPVGLNVTGHFTIARTRQQLLIPITTSKRS
jgi:hypothetical protein